MKNTKVRVLADADLVIEFLINRDKYIKDVEDFMEMISSSSRFSVHITDKCLKRLYLENDDRHIVKEAEHCIGEMFKGCILEINQQIREEARKLDIIDWDSAEEYICASTYNIDIIVTLNLRDFDDVPIHVCSIKDLLIKENLERAVTLNIPTNLQPFTNNQPTINCEGNSVAELLDQLEVNCPGIKARICDESGQPRRFLNIYVNDEDIRFLEGTATVLASGDKVSIVPAVAGG